MTTHKKDDDVTTSDLSTGISSRSRTPASIVRYNNMRSYTPPIKKLILLFLLLIFPWSCRVCVVSECGQSFADRSTGETEKKNHILKVSCSYTYTSSPCIIIIVILTIHLNRLPAVW